MHITSRAKSFFICGLLDNAKTPLGTSADSVTFLCHMPLRFDFVNMENVLLLASRRIGIIIRIAFAGDMGDMADKRALPRLDEGAAANCSCSPNAPAEVQTIIY
jgi:hypothetical protein